MEGFFVGGGLFAPYMVFYDLSFFETSSSASYSSSSLYLFLFSENRL